MRISGWSSDVCSSDRTSRLSGGGRDGCGAPAVRGSGYLQDGREALRPGSGQWVAPDPGNGHDLGCYDGPEDRPSVVQGKSASARVDIGGLRVIKKKKKATR